MPLTIYKASAGSGKTFQLTLSFLELIFKEPYAYRHILAVTFTNKAASEMKSRILERLYNMSILKDEETSEDIRLLSEACGFTREELIKKSKQLLTRILNDYSRFSVGTIDKFFQGVIRAFTKEIGLSAGFGLELDKNRVLGEAVDRMFMDIGDDPELLKWILKFADTKVESAKSWNFRNDIIKLGQQLFSEAYQDLVGEKDAKLSRVELAEFLKKLDAIEKEEEDAMIDLANLALTEMGSVGLDESDFLRGKSGVASYFGKVVNNRKFDPTPTQKIAQNELSKWISKNESDQGKISFVETVLQPRMREIYQHYIMANSASEARQYIYAFGILGDLSSRILDITDERNIFLISDSSRFLKGLIGDNPTPFVYEKTGNFLENIMLDEFQDTSVFQWDNFRPLLEHTLSTEQENVVVGDVKQSIYRWRNSDWKILAEEVSRTFGASEVTEKSLLANWRSSEQIIKFNNSLFSVAPEIVKDIITKSMQEAAVSENFIAYWQNLLSVAYSDVNQQVPDKALGTGGYIRGEVLANDDEKFKDLALERLPKWIMELEDNGFTPGDIAVLVRTNKEAADVARTLMQVQLTEGEESKYNFNFVSSDSLFLDNNPAVRFIISLLTYIHSPFGELNSLYLKYYYCVLTNHSDEDFHSVLSKSKKVTVLLGEAFEKALPSLKRLPLFELIEELIDLFKLDENQRDLPYLQALQEIVVDMQRKEAGSLHDFLNYWSEFGVKKSIVVSDQQDAIRIITIHKAKGLQFKAVLIPFCDWKLVNAGGGDMETILWNDTEGTVFEDVPVLPLKFRKNLSETIFAPRYIEELIMAYVDNLNLLYVAYTRAEELLIMALPEPSKKGDVSNAGQLVLNAARMANSSDEKKHINIAELYNDTGFEIGTIPVISHEGEVRVADWKVDKYPVNLRRDSLRLRLKNNEYFLKSEDSMESHLDFGNIMHEIFGMIKTGDDIDDTLKRYITDGLLKTSSAEEIRLLILEKINRPEVKDWFAAENVVYNEKEIYSEGKSYRPDRVFTNAEGTVVVDYKFGERNDKKYGRQVEQYMHLLAEMNYEKVRGYIWYVMLDEIIEMPL